MATITISKKEYQELFDKALRYEYFRQLIESDIFSSPPTKNIGEIVGAFKNSGKYGQQFIRSLEKGLKRSSCFKK